MVRKTYICGRWPSYTIGPIRFRDGRYITSDEDEQALIESRDSFGVQVQLVADEPGNSLAGEAEPAPRRGPGRPPVNTARQGQRNSTDL